MTVKFLAYLSLNKWQGPHMIGQVMGVSVSTDSHSAISYK